MLKFLKKKTARNKDEWCPVMKHTPAQHTDAGELKNTANFCLPCGSAVKVSTKFDLNTLRNILSEQSNSQDLAMAAATPRCSFCQEWNHEILHEIDHFVESHLPMLPPEGQHGSQLLEFLERTHRIIYNEVIRLTPALGDAGLLEHLMDSYSRHLFTTLDLLLNRELSVKETFCLIMWGKEVFFSPDSKLRAYDPLLLTGWFEKAKLKLLQILQNDISKTLQNILCYGQHGDHEDSMDEETFISLHIDVTQCLHCAILDAKKVGLTLMHELQILCSEELHGFVEKYVDAENKCLKKQRFTERNSVHLFRIINNCIQLRRYAAQINPNIKNIGDNSSTICLLQKLEDNTLSIVQKIIKCFVKANLGSYFKKRNGHIYNLIEAIQRQCESLPPAASEIIKIIVKIAYDCVSKVYLESLLKSNYRKLQKYWGNVEEKINEDIQLFCEKMSELDASVAQQNQFLQGMSEVFLQSDVDALKRTCCALFRNFSQESEQYVPGLLRWKKVLSKQQVREVMDAIRDQYPRQATRRHWMGFFCFLCQ